MHIYIYIWNWSRHNEKKTELEKISIQIKCWQSTKNNISESMRRVCIITWFIVVHMQQLNIKKLEKERPLYKWILLVLLVVIDYRFLSTQKFIIHFSLFFYYFIFESEHFIVFYSLQIKWKNVWTLLGLTFLTHNLKNKYFLVLLTSRISLILLPPLPMTQPAKLWCINKRKSISLSF